MIYTQADLDMADRHIAEGEAHIVSQERIIERLRNMGAPTDLAERLLRDFHDILASHRGHRELIVAGLKSSAKP